MQRQRDCEKTSSVEQLELRVSQPNGTGLEVATTLEHQLKSTLHPHGAGLEDAIVRATLHSVYGNQSAIASCGTKQMQQRPCIE